MPRRNAQPSELWNESITLSSAKESRISDNGDVVDRKKITALFEKHIGAFEDEVHDVLGIDVVVEWGSEYGEW